MSNFKPDKTMLQNYIQNKLNSTDTRQVELWLIDHPDVMTDLELDLMFKQAEFNPSEISSTTDQAHFSFLDIFSSQKMLPLHILTYALSALLIFNTFMVVDKAQISAVTFIELEKQRGINTTAIAVQSGQDKSLVLRFFPDSMRKKYSLVMESKLKNIKYNFINLIADELGSITVSIYSEKNMQGEWEVFVVDDTQSIEQKFLMLIN